MPSTVRGSKASRSTKLALELLVLTAVRSIEVREAQWREIDLAAKVWEIPAARMKKKWPHRIPLAPRAIDILDEARAGDDGSGFIFPGTKHGRPLSDMTLSKLVKELGFDADVHGFRPASECGCRSKRTSHGRSPRQPWRTRSATPLSRPMPGPTSSRSAGR